MATNYETIIRENLTRLFDDPPVDLAERMGAQRAGNSYRLRAFGEDCSLSPEGIRFSGNPATGPRGLLVSLYALNAGSEPMKTVPFRSFRELPGSMPYQGAFTSHTERVLVGWKKGISRYYYSPYPKSPSSTFFICRTRNSPPPPHVSFRPTPSTSCPWMGWPTLANTPPAPSCVSSVNRSNSQASRVLEAEVCLMLDRSPVFPYGTRL